VAINHLGHAFSLPRKDNEIPVVFTLNWDHGFDYIILKTASKFNAKNRGPTLKNVTINHLGHALNFSQKDNEIPVMLTLNWAPGFDCLILKAPLKLNAKTGDQLTYFGKTMPIASA
jgi:hypothetical protein